MSVPIDKGRRQPPPPRQAPRTGSTKRYAIGMPDNQLLERFIIGGVDRQAEFRFVVFECEYEGFISALDDTHLKITTTADLKPVLLQRSMIIAIEETGRRLSELLSLDQQAAIREYTAVFNRVVAREAARGPDEG